MPNYQLGDFFQAFHLEPQAQAKFRGRGQIHRPRMTPCRKNVLSPS
jgi:hypothetical protein